MARSMVIEYPQDSIAWKSDLQYMWGNELLVAPNCSDSNTVAVWLPKGVWYDFWDDRQIQGNTTIKYPAPIGKLPLFVKAGSIIPMAPYTQSTAFMRGDSLTLHVYTGGDAAFTLYEDDGVSEAYRNTNEKRITTVTFTQAALSLQIAAAVGAYAHAPLERAYQIVFHGLSKPILLSVNGTTITPAQAGQQGTAGNEEALWEADKKILSVFVRRSTVAKSMVIQRVADGK
jgi:alpha-D-xyloside xylohydrolase